MTLRALTTTLFCLALLGASACSGRQQGVADQQQLPVQFALAAPLELRKDAQPRQSSAATITFARNASKFNIDLPNSLVTANSDSATFAPDSPDGAGPLGGAAFAVYEADSSAGTPSNEVNLIWVGAPPAAGTAYIGLGNLQTNQWDWRRWTSGQPSSTGSMSSYIDGLTGQILVAVVLTGTQDAELRRVRLGAPLVGATGFDDVTAIAPVGFKYDLSSYVVPDSEVVSIEIDVDNDGVYDLNNQNLSGNILVSDSGTHTLAMRYTNDEGFISTKSAEVLGLTGLWDNIPLDGETGVFTCHYPNAGVVEGHACVVYRGYDGDSGVTALYFKRDLSGDGTIWSDRIEVDVVADVNKLSRLVIAGGNPAFLLANGQNDIYYYRANDPLGDTWAEPVSVRLNISGGAYDCDLAVVNGIPQAAYCGTSGSSFHRAALNAQGSVWSGVESDFPSSLATVAIGDNHGKPVIVTREDVSNFDDLAIYEGTAADGGPWERHTVHVSSGTPDFDVHCGKLLGNYMTPYWINYGPNGELSGVFFPGATTSFPASEATLMHTDGIGTEFVSIDSSDQVLDQDGALLVREENIGSIIFSYYSYDRDAETMEHTQQIIDTVPGNGFATYPVSIAAPQRIPYLFYLDDDFKLHLAVMR